MCTGAEPAVAAAAAAAAAGAGTAGAAAGTTAAAAGAGAAAAGAGMADAGLTALTAAPEMAAGMAGTSTAAVPGLLGAAPDIAGFESGLGAMGSTYPNAAAGELASVGETHNPLFYQAGGSATGGPNTGLMGAYDSIKPGLNRGMDAMNNMNKAQSAMNMMSPQRSSTTNIARPPSMGQPAQNVSQGSMGRPMGGLMGNPQQGGLDSAKLMMLKRMGLLGSM